jgi:hypothetical protein
MFQLTIHNDLKIPFVHDLVCPRYHPNPLTSESHTAPQKTLALRPASTMTCVKTQVMGGKPPQL